jgi:hypothetical protein
MIAWESSLFRAHQIRSCPKEEASPIVATKVDKVSDRALIGASSGSLVVGETKPQSIGPRGFSPLTEMIVSTISLGATL